MLKILILPHSYSRYSNMIFTDITNKMIPKLTIHVIDSSVKPDPSLSLYRNNPRGKKLTKDGVFLSVALRTVQSQQSTIVEVFYNPIKLQTEWSPLL